MKKEVANSSDNSEHIPKPTEFFKSLEPLSDALIDEVEVRLPPEIRQNIPRSATYVINQRLYHIVETCRIYPDGLNKLQAAVESVRQARLRKKYKTYLILAGALVPILVVIWFVANNLWLGLPERLRKEANSVPVITFEKGGNALLERQDKNGKIVSYTIPVKSFALDKQEVSNANYRKCVEAGVCKAVFRDKVGEDWYNDVQRRFDHPVVALDAIVVSNYCKWLDKRLPTEAEWDFAAQGEASTAQAWPWGNTAPTSKDATLDFNGLGDYSVLRLAPVTDFEQGNLKFNNIVGNAYELTSTKAEVDYSSYDQRKHEWDGRPPETTFQLVARGLSFDTNMRSSQKPNLSSALEVPVDNSNFVIGFRCAKSLNV